MMEIKLVSDERVVLLLVFFKWSLIIGKALT